MAQKLKKTYSNDMNISSLWTETQIAPFKRNIKPSKIIYVPEPDEEKQNFQKDAISEN